MTALVTARPAAPPASPPLPVGRDAAVDRALRLAAVLALWLGLLLITYWWVLREVELIFRTYRDDSIIAVATEASS
jgi:hypothetical protein